MADFKKISSLITDRMWAGSKYIPRPQKYRPLKRRKPRVLKLPDAMSMNWFGSTTNATKDYETPCLGDFEPGRDLIYSYGELVDCNDPRKYEERQPWRDPTQASAEDDGLEEKRHTLPST